jgi:RimJ/RimL family protein N-acetyltransferase
MVRRRPWRRKRNVCVMNNIIDIGKLHTTKMGAERIKNNLKLNTGDIINWCKKEISKIDESNIYKIGKNWYVEGNNFIITINSNSNTIITAYMKKDKGIKLSKLCDNDIKLIKTWLNKEHVKKWYENPGDWIYEMENRNLEYKFLNHFIVKLNGIRIGFCQYYDCFDAKEEWYTVSSKNETYSIDYMIGEEKYIGKGYGKEIIKLLENRIKKINGKEIIVQPDKENGKSIGILLANGFEYNERVEYYSKRI